VLRKTLRCAAALLMVAGLATGCGGSKKSKAEETFGYDASAPVGMESRLTTLGGSGLEVLDVRFDGPGNEPLDGYLVRPRDSGKHPAVIYAHGAGGDRSELLDEAKAMARQGVVALTLDMSYSPGRVGTLPSGMAGARARGALEVDAVREVRRSVDLLQSLPSVEDDHIGYVGWSAGARMGAVIAGVEHRIVAFDLLAGGAAPVSEYLKFAPAKLRPEFKKVLDRTDPLQYVNHAAPSALLFQDGRRDELVPREALRTLAEAGSEPKDIRWYDSGHVPSEKAWADSRRWLADHLGQT
jgi:dienelactone hydrolase